MNVVRRKLLKFDRPAGRSFPHLHDALYTRGCLHMNLCICSAHRVNIDGGSSTTEAANHQTRYGK